MRVNRRRLAVCGVIVAVGLLAVGISPPLASADVRGFEFERAFGHDGTSLSEFTNAGSVAVDQEEGLVYVLDRAGNALFKFDTEGHPVDFGGSSPDISGNELSGLAIGGGVGGRQVAVDSSSHTIYLTGGTVEENRAQALLAFTSEGEPAIFTAGPGAGKNEITGFYNLQGLAVDSSGNIYASDFGSPVGEGDITIYSPSGAVLVPGFGAVKPQGAANIAVDSNGAVYVLANSGQEVVKYIPSEFPVTSATTYIEADEFLTKNAISIAVEPISNQVFVLRYSPGQVSVFDEDGNPLHELDFGGPGEEGELETPEGIAVLKEGAMAYVAQSPVGKPSRVMMFRRELCICPPSIESTWATAVTGDSATLRALINPNNLPTQYWFEYGLDDCEVTACAKVPAEGGLDIGDGKVGVAVANLITGLLAQTTYHFRVVAENELERTEGPDRTFTTQGSGLGFNLSDSRVWEMVSPPKKVGGTIVAGDLAAIQASSSGGRLAYASLGSIIRNPAGSRSPGPATILAQREDDGRWTSRDLTPPHSGASGLRGETEYKLFNPDLTESEMEPTDATPLSDQASEQTPYLWVDGTPPVFIPLLNPDNVPPGTEFGPQDAGQGVKIEGASADLKNLVLRAVEVSLVEDAPLGAVYMWSDGGLEAVSRAPQSEGGEIVGGMLGSGMGSVRHAVSSDGSRVFWTPSSAYNAAGIGLPALYVWDREAGQSRRVDVVQAGGDESGTPRPAFNIASADGQVVFFTDSHRLTADASPGGRDLYRCEIEVAGGSSGCSDLTDISSPRIDSGSAEVMDQVSASSEDGTHLYFVARGVLDERPNAEGQSPIAGKPNLYLWREGEGNRFIATLSAKDVRVWGGQPTLELGYSVYISADASPSGRFFAFTSEESPTGYENRNSNGAPISEAFVYDAETDQLTCVSCNPTGAAAIGQKLPAKVNLFPPDPGGFWADRWVAAILPEASRTEPEGRSLYRPRSVLDNGRVFFNAVDPLVPADSNGDWDVYEFEPVGVGSCVESTGTAAMSRSGSGCVGLLSSGTSEGHSGFLDASESGDDVFFLTRGRLSVLDEDDEVDAYDARVNGVPAVVSQASACVGEACQPATGPPNDPTPASESFRAPDPTPRCRKGQKKVKRDGKTRCVKKKRKHRGHGKKKAGKERSAAR
jgi:DNA-binding beta-propeller fold protein YncE